LSEWRTIKRFNFVSHISAIGMEGQRLTMYLPFGNEMAVKYSVLLRTSVRSLLFIIYLYRFLNRNVVGEIFCFTDSQLSFILFIYLIFIAIVCFGKNT